MSDNTPPEISRSIQEDVKSAEITNRSFVSKAVGETAEFLFPVLAASRRMGDVANPIFTAAAGDIARYALFTAGQIGPAGEHTVVRILAGSMLLPNVAHLVKTLGTKLTKAKNG